MLLVAVNHDTDLHEGDIRLNAEQSLALEVLGNPTQRLMGARGITANASMLWSRTIPYVTSNELLASPDAVEAIMQGIEEWEQRSCLKFVRRTSEKDYINIFQGSGCWSYVGRQGGAQNLSLASGCWQRGTVAHEFGHAMGFWHEQSRPDRDDYVTIVWANIPEEKKHNFHMYSRLEIDSLGVSYDYLSIMHYSPTAFSSNGQPTIIPKDPNAVQLGQRVGFSPSDEKQADLLYKCNGTRALFFGSICEIKYELYPCTFDTPGDLCGYTNEADDDFDWTQRLGNTPSGSTGPTADHTTGRWGWFMFIETSSPRKQNETASLVSPEFPPSGKRCLHFYYHMYGSHMGSLAVTYRNTSAGTQVWEKKGDQGNAWKLASVQLPAFEGGYQVAFVGKRGGGYQGDAAIDDIYFTDGDCCAVSA
ncbi:predicted protein [Nematostella vectensis]|uniref:Metalloendopeptidase n=1 Tax=Nematostella vectensis TaxID=45351 RepID=A7SJ13_NEMVE|nr:predicted protein [Nematostella vectensis]|eukprot:XP_001628402.1 predicted protein [Nematostella vectensis]